MKPPTKTWQGDDFEECLNEVVKSRSDCFMKDRIMTKDQWIEKALRYVKSELQDLSVILNHDKYLKVDDDFFTAKEWEEIYTEEHKTLTELLRVAEEKFGIKGEG